MRTILFYWSVGLLSISGFAGCGNTCQCHCDSSQTTRTAPTPSDPNADTKPRRTLLVPWQNGAPESPGPIKQLPAPAASATRKDEEPLVIRVKTFPEADPIPEGPPSAKPEVVPPAKVELETGASQQVIAERPQPNIDLETGVRKQVVAELPHPRFAEEETAANETAIPVKSVPIPDGQADNFKTITGQVQTFRKTIRLRYSAIDQDDIYGGSVILDGAEVSPLREGQHVRVRGVLVPPETRGGTAHYRVQSVEILD